MARGVRDVRLFEIGTTFHASPDGATGPGRRPGRPRSSRAHPAPLHWSGEAKDWDIWDVRGLAQSRGHARSGADGRVPLADGGRAGRAGAGPGSTVRARCWRSGPTGSGWAWPARWHRRAGRARRGRRRVAWRSGSRNPWRAGPARPEPGPHPAGERPGPGAAGARRRCRRRRWRRRSGTPPGAPGGARAVRRVHRLRRARRDTGASPTAWYSATRSVP
jgi:hypothetical protein